MSGMFATATNATGCCPVGYVLPVGGPLEDFNAALTSAGKQVVDALAAKGVALVNKQLGIQDVGAYVVLPDGRRGTVQSDGAGGFRIKLENGTFIAYTGQAVATYKDTGGLNLKTGLAIGGGVIAIGLILYFVTRR